MARSASDLRDELCAYYRHNSVLTRMREFLGASVEGNPTALYITATDDGASEKAQPISPSNLQSCLEQGMDVERSLWDCRSLIADIDIEYINFDDPAAAWEARGRIFSAQAGVLSIIRGILGRAGIEPLVLLSGRGFHLVWSIDRGAPAFERLVRLGHVPHTLADSYRLARSPAGGTFQYSLGKAYAGLGLVMEFVATEVLKQAKFSQIALEITAVEVGPGASGREIVSVDVSEYGDPLHFRHIRLPFSVYLKPKVLTEVLGAERVDNMLPIFEIPLAGMSVPEAVAVSGCGKAAMELSRHTATFIPDQTEATAALVNWYEESELADFHRQFYRSAWEPIVSDVVLRPIPDAPQCLNWLFEHPYDWLLRPAAIQFVVRVLTALEWQPSAIAQRIADVYAAPAEWGNTWTRMDRANRAVFYTRLFAGMMASGVDELIDLNCVSQREKGYCFTSSCSSNLATLKERLERGAQTHERLGGRTIDGLFLAN